MRPSILLIALLQLAPHAFAGDNPKLAQLYEQDQSDRQGDDPTRIDWFAVTTRDAERRKAVLEMVSSAALTTSNDYFHAAMVFQHGSAADETSLAYSFATIASTLEPVHPKAQWLRAAAWDRMMIGFKKPQWYGTQFSRGKSGKWELYPVDEAVTDKERERMGVPTLEVTRGRAREMNEK